MTVTQGALAVDLAGLAQLVERRGKSFAIMELIQNAWDEPGVTKVRVEIAPIAFSPGRVHLLVEDDAPEGFADLTHAYTLFAPSSKKGNAEQRGRFNLGEKLVIALSTVFSVRTTKGTVEIDTTTNTRHVYSRKKSVSGSSIGAILRMNRDEMNEAIAAFKTLIPPDGIETTLNGELLRRARPLFTFEATLATEIADEHGFLRPSKRATRVEIYGVGTSETASLYEMGIPVVETGDTFHVNVMQKVPLNADRDNVPPAFLRDVRALVLNQVAPYLQPEESATSWVTEALEDDLVSSDAVNAVMTKRFGEKRVVYDMNDLEANRAAQAAGYTVIPGRALPSAAWVNVREYGAALPAGRVMPSPKPFHPGGKALLVIDPAQYTQQQRAFAEGVGDVHQEVIGKPIVVVLANDDGWPFGGTYGNGQIIINIARREASLNDPRTLETVLHEFGHYYGDHLTHEFDAGIAKVAAKLVLASRRFNER